MTYSITEPSAVVPDTKVYFGDISRQKREVNESRADPLRAQVDFQHPALPALGSVMTALT